LSEKISRRLKIVGKAEVVKLLPRLGGGKILLVDLSFKVIHKLENNGFHQSFGFRLNAGRG
jgi:hypothetical protein